MKLTRYITTIQASLLLIFTLGFFFKSIKPNPDPKSTPIHHHPYLTTTPNLPKCWGNQKDVGPCPEDYVFKEIPRELFKRGEKDHTGRWQSLPGLPRFEKVRVLYLRDRGDYLRRAYRYFYDEVEVASGHPGLDVRLWGKGFYDYNETESLDENIKRVFGSEDFFQIVYTSATTPPKLNLKHSVFIYSLGDCHNLQCLNEINPNQDILAFRYAFEPLDLFQFSQIKAYKKKKFKSWTPKQKKDWFPLLFHHTECSLIKNFHPQTPKSLDEKWQDSRPFDVRLFGQTEPNFYPLRHKVMQGMRNGSIRGEQMTATKWWQDPLVETAPKREGADTLGKFLVDDPETEHLQLTMREWGKGMRETKICVFDSSVERKTIRKFNEAFLSGCVVASDVPSEMEDLFGEVVIRLDVGMSHAEIDFVLGSYLEKPDLLRDMAVEAFYRAREHFSCTKKVDRLLEAAVRYHKRERGYGLSATCRTYSTKKVGTKNYNPDTVPAWCRDDELF